MGVSFENSSIDNLIAFSRSSSTFVDLRGLLSGEPDCVSEEFQAFPAFLNFREFNSLERLQGYLLAKRLRSSNDSNENIYLRFRFLFPAHAESSMAQGSDSTRCIFPPGCPVQKRESSHRAN